MNCPGCTKGNRSTAIFCAYCGKRLYASTVAPSNAEAAGRRLAQAAKSKTAILVSLSLVGLLIMIFLVASNNGPAHPTAPSEDSNAELKAMSPEFDIPRLGFASRHQVIDLIGRRLGVAPNGEDQYSWGTLEYKNGRVIALDYHYQQRPSSVESALAKVGLAKTSEPIRRESSNYQWAAPFAPALVCCGFRFENVLLSGDFSDITVVFEKRTSR